MYKSIIRSPAKCNATKIWHVFARSFLQTRKAKRDEWSDDIKGETPLLLHAHGHARAYTLSYTHKGFSKRRPSIRPRLCITTRVLCSVVISKVTRKAWDRPPAKGREKEKKNLIVVFVILPIMTVAAIRIFSREGITSCLTTRCSSCVVLWN